MNFEETFFNDLLDTLYSLRQKLPTCYYDEVWNASLKNSIRHVCSFFGRDVPAEYTISAKNEYNENTFGRMIKTLLTLYIPNSKNIEHKVWNSALRTVIIKLYQFFNAGDLPKDISELFFR